MKKLNRVLTSFLITALLTSCAPTERQQQALKSASYKQGKVVYRFDNEQSRIGFSVRQNARVVVGVFKAAEGQLTFNSCDADSVSLEVTIASESVDVDNVLIESIIRGRGWFESKDFPLMRFDSRSVRFNDGGAIVAGNLTVRDLPGEILLDVGFPEIDPLAFPAEIAFTAKTSFSRSRYGMTAMQSSVADDIVVDIEGSLGVAQNSCN